MKKSISLFLLTIICLMTSITIIKASSLTATNSLRDKINFNRDWKFILEDIKGGESTAFDDKSWQNVNIPHSFAIPYFMWAKVYNGYGWYRKSFEAPASWEGKSVSIELEGAFIETEIYINGTYVGKHVGGYTGFCFDITPYIQTGTNTVAIRVNNLWKANVAPRAGDHQFSGGIYRDVYLNVTNKLHVDWFGTFLTTPEVSTSSAKIKAVTSVKNDYQAQKTFSITTEIYAPNDQLVSSVTSNNISVAAGKTIDITQLLPTITFPQLWSPTTPNLYKAVTKLITNGNQTDSYQTTFGIRFTQWTSSGGFYLNGTKLYLIGANVHQDRAGWGDAATNAAFFRDVKLMKDAGFNSIRGCHYPHDPGFVSACDNLGIIFFSENAFWGMGGSTGDAGNWGIPSSGSYPTNAADQKDFNLSVLQQLKEMIRIHRNSPSIMAWSMSNEPFFSDDITMPKVRALLNETTDSTTLWDPSRFVAIGGCQRQGLDKLGKGQVAFYNGDGAGFPNPGVPNMVSEYSSRSAQRPGDFGPAWGELGSNNNIDSPAPSWRGGQAIWCGIDHGTVGGEGLATMGLVDYFRLPKRQYYWYQECYAKGNRNPIPPTWPTNGTPAKLKIESNKSEISVPDGTDDVMLTVTVQNSIGKTINNNVPVTLKLISGPGEFPTGRSITFLPPDNNNEQTDISIREGMCAIDFRSYYGGISVIEASSPGLQSAKIEIITHGTPRWEEGVTPPVADRPYKRYKEKEPPKPVKDLLLAKDRPCSASTTETTSNKSYANDSDETTSWTPKPTDRNKWWKLDMEATYSLNRIQIVFPTKGIYKYKIEVSPDDKNWQKVIDQSDNATAVKSHMNYGNLGRNVRFVRVKFNSMAGIAEIRVGGSSDLPEKPDLLTGTIIGIEGSWENVEKATKEAAFDFDQTTFFDAPEGASGFWVGIDLGKGAEFKPTQATYFPRTELGVRMKNGTFETGESIEFTEAKTLYTISANAPERYTTINFNAPSYTRYIRYRSTPEGNGNVAELEFFGKSRLDGINDITTDQSHYATINIDGDNNIKLQIDESAPFPRKAELFSHDGKILNSISTQDNQLTLSRLREPNGIYLIRVSMGNTTEVYKVIL